MIRKPYTRRQALGHLAATGAAAVASPSILRAQAATKVRVGYLHVLSVDAHLLLAGQLGSFQKEGIEVEQREFTTGIELFQALVGGSLDVLSTGGVLANFPARGQGKVFLINDLEYATGQIWVHPDQGINSIADLKGKKVATTRGTTAHNLLHQVLKGAGLDSNKDVEIVNQRMSEAVTTFIAGAVPAVAIWVPFNVPIKAKATKAKMLASAADYPSATIVDGWAARNDFYDNQKDVLKRIIRAWVPANDYITSKPQEAIASLHQKFYSNLTAEDMTEMHGATKWFSTADWVNYYRDGTAAKWLNQVTNFNVEVGAIQNPLMADKYFDPSLFLDAVASLGK
jgi:NitT/TauT family transport system substrate-binding protein